MGFTSYDDLIAELTAGKRRLLPWQKTSLATVGVANTWYSAWPWTGMPPAGAYTGTALNAQQCTQATAGGILHGGDVSPDTKHLLSISAQVAAATAVPGRLILYDRLLYYPGINAAITSGQTLVNGVALPRYTTGERVMMWLEVTTALGTGTGVVTIAYTDAAGNTGNAFGAVVNSTASSALARLSHSGTAANMHNPFLPLAAGDTGIRSAQTITFTTAHSAGAVALVLGVPLATLPLPAVNVLSERELVIQMANLERVVDGACLAWLVFEPGALVASTPFNGDIDLGWG